MDVTDCSIDRLDAIGVEIARGLARSVERAATGGRSRGSATRGRNAEWDPSSC